MQDGVKNHSPRQRQSNAMTRDPGLFLADPDVLAPPAGSRGSWADGSGIGRLPGPRRNRAASAAPRRVGDPDVAAMGTADPGGDGQAHATPSIAAMGTGAPEPIKHPRQIFRGDAGSVIAPLQKGLASLAEDTNPDQRSLRAVAMGVVQQVANELMQQPGMPMNQQSPPQLFHTRWPRSVNASL